MKSIVNDLDIQVLAVLNSILLDNFLMYGQPNVKTLWAHLWTLIEISSSVLIFANYQRTIIFQISGDQDSTSQIAELDFLYMRLYRNDCDVSSVLRAMIFLFMISHLWNFISVSIFSSYMSISNLTWNIVYFE